MDRRVFLQSAAGAIGGLAALEAFSPLLGAAQSARPDLAVVKGVPVEKIVRMAIDALGGIKRFISRGDVVVIKPNIGWDRTPEQAANTNPEVVATLVKLCLEAEAKRVKVFDRSCQDPRRCYVQSGIEAAARAAGAEVFHIGGRTLQKADERRYRDVKFPNGVAFKSWPISIDALEADKLINVPIAKHHGASRLTMSLKNWMGLMGDNRGRVHQNLDAAIVDLSTVIKPHLTILDAVRILTANGPTGGSLNDVKRLDTVIAGVDQVAIDSYGATLFGLKAEGLDHVAEAAKRGLGKMDLSKLNIRKIDV
ncbi:MAG: DUF362 domain-containing protein [Holophagales bacterium]|jgi:uncharacterized protein (DUF362 family)|nr:DUF362 domain-containing protein [Holophagales bacterium]